MKNKTSGKKIRIGLLIMGLIISTLILPSGVKANYTGFNIYPHSNWDYLDEATDEISYEHNEWQNQHSYSQTFEIRTYGSYGDRIGYIIMTFVPETYTITSLAGGKDRVQLFYSLGVRTLIDAETPYIWNSWPLAIQDVTITGTINDPAWMNDATKPSFNSASDLLIEHVVDLIGEQSVYGWYSNNNGLWEYSFFGETNEDNLMQLWYDEVYTYLQGKEDIDTMKKISVM